MEDLAGQANRKQEPHINKSQSIVDCLQVSVHCREVSEAVLKYGPVGNQLSDDNECHTSSTSYSEELTCPIISEYKDTVILNLSL